MSKNEIAMHNPFLVGARLYLRPLEPAQDNHHVARWQNGEEMRNDFNVYPTSDARTKERLDQMYRSFSHILLGIVLKKDNTLIGIVGLKDINTLNQTAEFYSKIDPSVQGEGYGTEATRLMTEYGFMELNLNRIQTQDLEEHVSGWHANEEAGFHYEVTMREAVLRSGRYQNVRVYSLLRSEFQRPNEQK